MGDSAVELPVPDGSPRPRFRAIKSSNYDISNTCNLTCEGCYYFVSGQKTENRKPSAESYESFFAAEASRGVNYPQFSGGEPSLNRTALTIAAKHWTAGIIYTNGLKRIDRSIPFRIAISIWGAEARNDRLRGAGAYERALTVAMADPRALIYLTVNRENVEDIPEIVAQCARRGLKISFNDFSMTTEYIRLMAAGDTRSNPFVRFSTDEANLSLRPADRMRAGDLIDRAMDDFPDNIVYSRILNDWVHRQDRIHSIDPETGIATDCAYLGVSWHRGYDFNLEQLKGKPCCAPEFDCADCRVGPVATWTLMRRLSEKMRTSPKARSDLYELREYMMRHYFWEPSAGGPGAAASSVGA